jgi:hypothetical protein
MANYQITVNNADTKKAFDKITRGLIKPFEKTKILFYQLGAIIDRNTMMTFKNQGNYGGRKKWLDYNWGQGVNYKGSRTFPSSTRYRSGNYKLRPGTDNSKGRRFSSSSKLLQASGSFRYSFRILNITNKSMEYGTNLDIAEKIMSNPERQVLDVTPKDKKDFINQIMRWYNGEFSI